MKFIFTQVHILHLTQVVATNYAYIGMGDRDAIIIDGDMVLMIVHQEQLHLKILHFRGSDCRF